MGLSGNNALAAVNHHQEIRSFHYLYVVLILPLACAAAKKSPGLKTPLPRNPLSFSYLRGLRLRTPSFQTGFAIRDSIPPDPGKEKIPELPFNSPSGIDISGGDSLPTSLLLNSIPPKKLQKNKMIYFFHYPAKNEKLLPKKKKVVKHIF